MARNQSFGTLLTRAYELTGIPLPANETAGYIPKPEMRRYLNEGLARVFRTIVRSSPDWVEIETSVAVVSGTDTYAMPVNFWQVRSVSVAYQGRDIPMRRYMSSERYQYQTGSQIPDWRYRIVDSGIRVTGAVQFQIRPTPTTAATVTVYYLPNPPLLTTNGTDDGVVLDGVAGWDDLAVLHAAIKAKEKQEEDVADLKDDAAGIEAEISVDATDRDQGEPKRVRDVERDTLETDMMWRTR